MRVLYHTTLSPFARKVRVVLAEKSLEFTLKLEKVWERRPEFLALNPAGEVPVLRVSFVKTLELMRPLWLTLALGGDLLSARQKQQLTERFLERAGRYVTEQRKRPRSCPRAVRQPVSGWPRLRRNQSWDVPVRFTLL